MRLFERLADSGPEGRGGGPGARLTQEFEDAGLDASLGKCEVNVIGSVLEGHGPLGLGRPDDPRCLETEAPTAGVGAAFFLYLTTHSPDPRGVVMAVRRMGEGAGLHREGKLARANQRVQVRTELGVFEIG